MAVYSPRLTLQSDKVKAKGVSLDALVRSGVLAQGDVDAITSIRPQQEDVSRALEAGVKLLASPSSSAYGLAILGDLLDDLETRAKQLADQPNALGHLLKLASSTDDFIRFKSLSLLAPSLASKPDPASLNVAFAAIARTIAPPEQEGDDFDGPMIGLQCAALLFKQQQARQIAWQNDDKLGLVQAVVNLLSVTLQHQPTSAYSANGSAPGSGTATPLTTASNGSVDSSAASPQLHYYIGLAFWVLTFEPSVAQHINAKYPKLIPMLNQLARNAVKEKVVRVIIATFRNLASLAPEANLPSMLSARLLPFLKLLTNSKKWSDEEIKADVEALREQLQETKKTLTTFDEYEQELESGYLTWDTPTHTDDEFWRLNASKLLDKDKKGVKALVETLQSNDPTILAIACNDIAQFIKFCDLGRKALSDTPAKTRVMELMNHPEQQVRFKALLAVQRLVTHSWE